MSPSERSLDVEALLAQSGWARRLALRLVGDAQLADDVVQDAWVAALERPPEGARLREWFAAVVRNLALRRARREAARGDVERRAERREPPAGADAALERLQLQRRLADLVLALEEPCRTALVLRHLEGLSAREVAARTGCSEEAARARVSRGLARLRAELDAQSGGDRGIWCGALAALWGTARDSNMAPVALSGASAGLIGGTLVGAKATLAVVAVGLTLGGAAWLARDGTGAAQPARPETALAVAPAPAGTGAEAPGPEATDAADVSVTRGAVAAPPAPARLDGHLRGRVLDDRGVPLAGVEVLLLEEVGDGPRASTTSDSAGGFALALGDLAPPADGAWHVRAQLEGHVPADVELPGPELGDLVLARRPLVSGILLRPDGTPAAPPGRIELSLQEDSGEQRWTYAEIDELGRFSARELAPGRLLEVRGLARGFGVVEERPGLELAPAASHELTLTLTVGDTVRGVVVDADSGEPVPFAEVWSETWSYDADSIEPSTVADAGGHFELRGVRGHTVNNDQGATAVTWVRVTARAEGYQGRPFEPSILRRGEDGELGQLLLRIGRADGAVSGRLTWPDGSAAAGVPLYSVDDGMNLKFAQSDGEGRFELEGLALGPLWICARTADHPELRQGRADAQIALSAGERATCELVLAPPEERILGRVVDEHGVGLAGVEVEAGEQFSTGRLTMNVGHHRATTDAEGRYTFANLSPGKYQVEISASERRERAARPGDVQLELAAGVPCEEARFELVPAVVCAGWVDVGGADPASFEVARVSSADGEEQARQPLGPDGRFRFEGCWPEACAITLLRDGNEIASVEVGAAGAEGIVLAAPR